MSKVDDYLVVGCCNIFTDIFVTNNGSRAQKLQKHIKIALQSIYNLLRAIKKNREKNKIKSRKREYNAVVALAPSRFVPLYFGRRGRDYNIYNLMAACKNAKVPVMRERCGDQKINCQRNFSYVRKSSKLSEVLKFGSKNMT